MIGSTKTRSTVATALFLTAACTGDPTTPPGGDPFDPVRFPGSWSTVAALPEPVVTGGAAAVAGKIWVVGGSLPGESAASPKVFRYDPDSNAWERLADLPEGLWRPGVAAKGDTVLVVGGNLQSDGVSPRSNVWRWDEATLEWVHHSRLPLPSSSPHTAGTPSGVFVAGLGSLQPPPGDSTAFQVTESSEWRYTAPAPLAISRVGSVGNEIWAVGLSTHATLDASALTWSIPASLPSSDFVVGAWRVPGRKHLLTRLGTAVTHLVLEDGAVTWGAAAKPEGLGSRIDALSVAVGERLYLIGGSDRSTPTTRVDVFTWN